MASADGELFKDTFAVDAIDSHEVENASGELTRVKDKKFDKGVYRLATQRLVSC